MGNRRIWWGVGIMAAGLCASWPFRKSWLPDGDVELARTVQAAPLVLRTEGSSHQSAMDRDEPLPAQEAEPLSSLWSALHPQREDRQFARLDQSQQPPALAGDYAVTAENAASDLRSTVAASLDRQPTTPSQVAAAGQRRYRIRKHDTLAEIAERLLGSREHAGKLLAANPDVIIVPEILPVGATITVPDIEPEADSLVRLPGSGE